MVCLAWPGASHTNRGDGRLVGCVFCGAPVLGIALALAAPNPTSLLESCSARSLAGEVVSRCVPRYRDTASGIYRECCTLSVVCARSPTCRPGSGSGLEKGSSRGVPPRADAVAHPTSGVFFSRFSTREAFGNCTCAPLRASPAHLRFAGFIPKTLSHALRPGGLRLFRGKTLSPFSGSRTCTARRALIGTSCLLGRKTRR